ncbi:oxidoreductase [Exophiala viscosa]|uniref:Oxidoreductase n=1 Tax=Exophiala viscosa TaxID=2486360 RepID=A0AAN6E290_9EURO|nr:oxidoreductase [Exophiala viscosa]KAI1629613.1 oxidoreductase [Exophiala viscosa]
MGKFANKLRGQHVVVIGGSTGIGFGAAEALLDVGARVTIISSNKGKVDAAVERLGSPDAKGVVANVREEEAFVQSLRSFGVVDHIVYSAVDNIIRGKLEDLDIDAAKHLFGVKLWGAIIVGKAVAKYDIIRKGGSLTLTSGTAGIKPGKGAAGGSSLNGGVLSLTKSLATDLAEKKIRVNTVVPGLVKTPLWDKQGKTAEEQKELFDKASQTLPVGFVATPEHIAEAYLYTIRADYATGTLVEIDGGTLL